MKYIPNTYDEEKINQNFNSYESFLNLQMKYREEFERIIKENVNLSFINETIKDLNIPKVNDQDYNFYHKFSTLNNDYLFLRNNFHVENLTPDELTELIFDESLNPSFFQKTLEKVLFEKEDHFYAGKPLNQNQVNSKSLVFEFAYDETKCESLQQINDIKLAITKIFTELEKKVKEIIGLNCSFVIYNYYEDLFKDNDQSKMPKI